MRRFLPSSLLGQTMLVLAIGLLIAQAVSAILLYRAAEERREAVLVNTIAFRVFAEQDRSERREERQARREAMRLAGITADAGPVSERRGRGDGRMRFGVERGETPVIEAREERLYDYETALREILDAQGVEVGKIAIVRRVAASDPFVTRRVSRRPELAVPGWQGRSLIVASIQRGDERGWMTFRVPEFERRTTGVATILFQTIFIFVVLVLLLFFVLRRMTRPLAQLTGRLDDFSRSPGQGESLAETGPADTRRLIAAYNAMEQRIAALLDEKDVMLGAIGHDLKTPLAALRVRIESVPDEIHRSRMAESIEDIAATLDDILMLARVGRTRDGAEAVDLGKLALGVVEEFEDLEQPVEIVDPPRIVAQVQVTWIKRALRNLVANAVRYAGAARISLATEGNYALVRVDDDGPGIPAGRIGDMLEPFTRGEASRNRATGGAGLGLTLARAIAEQHGGQLRLTNRPEGGLRAEIRLPL